MDKNKYILAISGYTGFIGKNFIENLNSNIIREIYLISRSKVIRKIKINVKCSYLEVGNNYKKIYKYKKEMSCVNFFFHFGYQNNLKKSQIDPKNDKLKNLKPIKYILDLLKKNSSFIFTSSASVYGNLRNNSNYFVENSKINPLSNYDLNKLECEKFISKKCNNSHIKFIIFRLSNIYGQKIINKDTGRGFLANIVNRICKNKDVHLDSCGNLLRDYLHINDCIFALNFVFRLNNKYFNKIYNLTSNKSYTINNIIFLIKSTLKKSFKINSISRIFYNCKSNLLKTDLRNFRGSSNLYRSITGWKNRISMKAGISRIIKNNIL